MRLIDGDELRRRLDEGVWNSSIEEVDNMPTAFDVEEVIKTLKDHKYHHAAEIVKEALEYE